MRRLFGDTTLEEPSSLVDEIPLLGSVSPREVLISSGSCLWTIYLFFYLTLLILLVLYLNHVILGSPWSQSLSTPLVYNKLISTPYSLSKDPYIFSPSVDDRLSWYVPFWFHSLSQVNFFSILKPLLVPLKYTNLKSHKNSQTVFYSDVYKQISFLKLLRRFLVKGKNSHRFQPKV